MTEKAIAGGNTARLARRPPRASWVKGRTFRHMVMSKGTGWLALCKMRRLLKKIRQRLRSILLESRCAKEGRMEGGKGTGSHAAPLTSKKPSKSSISPRKRSKRKTNYNKSFRNADWRLLTRNLGDAEWRSNFRSWYPTVKTEKCKTKLAKNEMKAK